MKFKRLDEFEVSRLFNDWNFMSLIEFIDDVENERLMDCDGIGEFLYANKKGIIYSKEHEHIHPSEIMEIFSELKEKKKRLYDEKREVAEEIRRKYAKNEYIPFAILWFNR